MADLRRSFGPVATSAGRNKSQVGPDSQDPDRNDETGEPKAKRRRTAVACAACRLRKSRCNGKRPKCSMCESLDLECAYDASDSSINSIANKEHMIEVQTRLHDLEAAVRRHEQALRSNDMLLSGNDDNSSFPRRGFLGAADENTSQTSIINAGDLRSADIQESFPENASTDGMAITYISEEDSGYFGQTSNIAFMRHISRAMVLDGNQEGLTSPQKSDEGGLIDNGIVNVSRPPSPNLGPFPQKQNQAHRGVMLNTLPSESITRGLIEKYFSNTGSLFPYIHAASFWETYEQMKSADFKKVRRTWLGLLNMVLAMASNAHSRHTESQLASERIAQSDEYYQRALGLCQTQILRGSSLETVQYLLLMSQYLQGTQKSVQTWSIHGLAVKAAMSIGLHSSDASRKFLPVEREFRNRTWFGCVVLDRTLSMTFGRPMTIPEEYVQLPLPRPDDNGLLAVVPEEFLPTEETRSVAFFNATVTLYRIMGRVIATLYGRNLGCGPLMPRKEMATAIFQFEQEIDEWIHSLPSFLRLLSSSTMSLNLSDNPVWMRYQVILSLRCLNLQVLLYRPVLSRSIDRSAEVAVHSTTIRSMDQIAKTHIDSCLTSAREIIDMVHMLITSPEFGKHLLGAWWFSLYYVFNSALVNFGSLLAYPKHTSSSASSDQVGACRLLLARAIEALRLLDGGNAIVESCALFIEEMAHKLDVLHGTVPDPGGEMTASHSEGNLAGADSTRMVRFLSPRRHFNQENGPTNALGQNQEAVGAGFLFEHANTDDLELGQFFLGGGMDSWVDDQG